MVFRMPDPDHTFAAVGVRQMLGRADQPVDLASVGGGWERRLPQPPVQRIQYLFEITDADGDTTTVVDPGNPARVGGPFGEHSVLELPGYVAPSWVADVPVEGTVESLPVMGTPVGDVGVQVWSPTGSAAHQPLPLLVAHDGPELVAYAGLTHFVGVLVATGALPPLRVALLAPGRRNDWYSANDDYAETLTRQVVPAVHDGWTTTRGTVLMGTSLGALAALHAEWRHPGTFAGLFLQSGSFFTAATDPQERDFEQFDRVTAFVGEVLGADAAPSRPAIGMTAGATEENVHNNRVLADRLRALDYDVSYGETPDVHNFTSWRDALDPHLGTLLRRVWEVADGA